VSFSGCGFLGLYHVGVASCLKTYAPQIYVSKVSGASAGSMAALALLADLPLGDMTSQVLKIATEARKCTLGPFSPSFNINQILLDGLQNILPDDVHEKVNGKLHVSLTKVYDGKNLLVNAFSSKQEVIDVILASAFIPIFSGWLPPRYRGVRVIDGGYSDNLPVLDTNTITVSPFCGNSDICPQDDYILTVLQVQIAGTSIEMSKDNMIRLSRVLLPPDPEVLSKYCKQGFEDALRFLQRRYLISCTRCLAVDSTYQIESDQPCESPGPQSTESSDRCSVYDPNCLECKLKRHIAQQSTVPENVWKVFEEAIDEAENGFTSWLKTINSYRVVRLLTYPARLQISVAMKLVTRLSGLQSVIGEDSLMRRTVENLSEQLFRYATTGGFLQTNHRAKYTCEMNITQYGEEESRRDSVKDILNLGLTAHMECDAAPQMPHDRMSAVKFQHENMSAAVSSGVQSSGQSRVVSRGVSTAPSLLGSRMGSRCNSMSSLYELDGPLPDTIGQIQQVTEQQEAVMSYYYTGEDNQVKLMEIFDVSRTEPSLLAGDQLGVNYSQDQVIRHNTSSDNLASSSIQPARLRHSSEPVNVRKKSRHLSGPPAAHSRTSFKVGDIDSDQSADENDDQTYCENYSDPEADWVTEAIQS